MISVFAGEPHPLGRTQLRALLRKGLSNQRDPPLSLRSISPEKWHEKVPKTLTWRLAGCSQLMDRPAPHPRGWFSLLLMLSLIPSNCGGSRVYSLGSLKANAGQREVPRDSCGTGSPGVDQASPCCSVIQWVIGSSALPAHSLGSS